MQIANNLKKVIECNSEMRSHATHMARYCVCPIDNNMVEHRF